MQVIDCRYLVQKCSSAFIVTMICSLALWCSSLILFGSDYPYNYDSINYALGMVDDFDIGKHQPHAYGYVYHILMARLWLPIVKNPFRVQQLQNIIYLFFALVCMAPPNRKNMYWLLIPATIPLSLFFAATSVIHTVSFTASAAIASLIVRLEQRRLSPVLLTSALAVFIGFRQDLALFMTPVVLVALLRYRCSVAEWLTIIVVGAILTAIWYVGTSWSSGWLSPWREANKVVRPFLAASSPLYGASLFQWARVVLRLFMYVPAVIGPGGLLFICSAVRSLQRIDLLYMFFAVGPFFLYGILFLLGVPTYLATITGFVFAWIILNDRCRLSRPAMIAAIAANLLYFLVLPAPLTEGYGDFSSRTVLQSVVKQLSYCGSVGCKAVTRNRAFERFLDKNVRPQKSFSAVGIVNYDGIPYWRAWNILAERVWNTPYASSPDSAACIIANTGDLPTSPDKKFENIGLWYPK